MEGDMPVRELSTDAIPRNPMCELAFRNFSKCFANNKNTNLNLVQMARWKGRPSADLTWDILLSVPIKCS